MKPMLVLLCQTFAQRLFLLAIPLALGLALAFPTTASAHAVLLRSDPAQDAVLNAAPQRVRMWFGEDLNPALSTETVVNGENKRVDNRDAHFTPGDPREMDITLQLHLPPEVYVVIWRTGSAADGHILSSSFLFSIARPDGTIPTLNKGANPGAKAPGGNSVTEQYMGQIDGPTLFNLIIITLVELAAVFWVGAQFWLVFVLCRASKNHEEQREMNQQVWQYFEQRLLLPTLIVLLLANTAVVAGQLLIIVGGQWNPHHLYTLLIDLITNGRFGIFWMIRELIIIFALLSVLFGSLFKEFPRATALLPWLNPGYGLALFVAISMSSHASAVNSNIVVFAIAVDYLHLVAAAFWVGGMMFIATTYLPVLSRHAIAERAHSLTTLLPYYSPWALAAVATMALTGPFSATFHLSSWKQLITTTYGQALSIKILLVCALLMTSAIHVVLLRPRLKKEHRECVVAVEQLQAQKATIAKVKPPPKRKRTARQAKEIAETNRAVKLLALQVETCEVRLARGTQRLTSILRWEPMLGVGVMICVGLMNVFAGTLSPAPATVSQQKEQFQGTSKPFETMVRTSDNKFTVMLNVNPNHLGTNVFTASVIDNSTGKPTTNVGASLYTTALDMDMGTGTINLLPDGKGRFSASGDLNSAGNWRIRIQLRTPDNTLHEAIIKLLNSSVPASPVSIYPLLALSYAGRIADSGVAGTVTNLGLTQIKQNQSQITGHFQGLYLVGPFMGTVSTSGVVNFTVKIDVGVLICNGFIKVGGELVGAFKVVDLHGTSLGEYGPLSAEPIPS